MSSLLAGLHIAVIGGDEREKVLVNQLVNMGAMINVVGLPIEETNEIKVYSEIVDAVKDIQGIILPMPGTDQQGIIRAVFAKQPLVLNEDIFKELPRGIPILVGAAKPYLKELASRYQSKLIEIADRDDIAILNSIPSAEGAIQTAMEETDITIHGSHSIVLGYGRCGVSLARMLAGIGAKTYVAARKPKDIARIYEQGYTPVTYNELKEYISSMDIIFNTVPQLVLTRSLLRLIKPGTVIIDIASPPGGVDFAAAREFGVKAILAPGLPGKVAPKTAGLILAKALPDILLREINGC